MSLPAGNRIRILQVVPNLGSGGGERVAAYVAMHLDRSRYDGHVLSLYPRENTPLALMLDEMGVAARYLAKRPGFSPRMFVEIDRVLRDFQPHVLHTHRYVLRYTLGPSLLRRIPVRVHTVHTLAHEEQDRSWARWLNPLAYRSGVIPVAVSEAVQTSLELRYGVRDTPVITNGIPVERYARSESVRAAWRASEAIPPDAIVIACVARLGPPKDQLLLLEAFASLRPPRGSLALLLVGEGPGRATLLERIVTHGRDREVHLLGVRADIPDILASSDIFVLPSNREGSPLALIEAMAAGMPIVASAVGGVPQMITHEHSGILVPPGDLAALFGALGRLLSDAALRRTLGDNARREARQRFSVDAMTRSYEMLYERLLSGS